MGGLGSGRTYHIGAAGKCGAASARGTPILPHAVPWDYPEAPLSADGTFAVWPRCTFRARKHKSEAQNQDEVVNAIWRALIQGCDDGTYFDRDGDLLVVDGRLNLPIVAQDLQQRLAVINNKGKPH